VVRVSEEQNFEVSCFPDLEDGRILWTATGETAAETSFFLKFFS